LSNRGFILIKKNEYNLRDHYSARDVLDQGVPHVNRNHVTQRPGSVLGQFQQEGHSSIRTKAETLDLLPASLDHNSRTNKQPQRVVIDVQNARAVQTVDGICQKKGPYKHMAERRSRLMTYLAQGRPRTENEMRRKIRSSYKVTHEIVKEMCIKGVMCPLRLSTGTFYVLTKPGVEIWSMPLENEKVRLRDEILGLPTTYNLDDNDEKNFIGP
jgi:hypothetical protein